jgi:hypothetical protein
MLPVLCGDMNTEINRYLSPENLYLIHRIPLHNVKFGNNKDGRKLRSLGKTYIERPGCYMTHRNGEMYVEEDL